MRSNQQARPLLVIPSAVEEPLTLASVSEKPPAQNAARGSSISLRYDQNDKRKNPPHSHSIVLGGLLEMS